MKRKLMLLMTCLMIGIGLVNAQISKVTGNVTSEEDGLPVVGASVLVKGTTVGTVTDIDGNFTLTNVPSSAGTLVISFIGMQSQEVKIKSNVNVVLKSDAEQLEEVMVVAYGTAKKSAFTGSAATIKNEKITSRQTSNVTNALAGQVAGVQTTSSTGQPGKDATVRIRGIGSISASNTPLYVVDGVPYDGEISAISTSDIESMTVLKDAASNALYGARGANGVILITTKRGKTGDARVTFDAKWGVNKRGIPSYETVSDPGKFYEMAYSAIYNADLKGYAAAGDLTSANAYANKTMLSSSYLGYQVFTVPNGEQLIGMDGKLNPNATLGYSDGTYYYKPDNWSDELFENNLRQEYNLSVSGANDKMNYYMSAGYLDDQGIVPNSGFQRYSARLKADYQVKPWLKMSGNISFTHYDSREQDTESGTSNANAFYAANIMGAIYPMYIRDAEGNIMIDNRGFQRYDYGSDTNFQRKNVIPNANPLASYMLDLMKYSGDVVSGKWSADIDIWGGIKAKINIGIDANNVRSTDLVNPFYGQYSETSGVGGIVSVSTQRTFSTNQQYLLTYNKTFNHIHNLDVLAGHENYNYKYQYLYGSREKIYNPNLPELNNGIMNQSNASYSQSYATEGWLFRVQYDYDGKYFGSASYRRDGSSAFHPDNRWGNFWSVGAGWLMNKESFLENQNWIDMLKFKISYGLQGNDNLLYMNGYRNYQPYMDQYTLTNNNSDFATTLYYKGNQDITWETSHSFNTGFDFAFWKGKLSGSIEYFSRKTTDMLYFKPVASSMGYSRFPENVGSMINRGVELDLNSNIFDTKDLTWDINFNLTHFKNKVLELAPELNGQLIDGSRIYREGESMYQLYLPKYAGVDPETGESLWALTEPNEKGETTTTSYSEASSHRFMTGDILPKVYGGFGTSLTFKGFDFSIAFAYQLGGRILDYTYQSLMSTDAQGSAWHVDMLNAWTPENKNTNVPRMNVNDIYVSYSSDRWLTSSNYLSLQNITFGYTLPKNWTRKLQVEGVRLYFVADNVALLTARKGLDPRQGYVASDNVYSPIRTISGGISLNF
ncbi:susC/RagA family TonB-linked outer membrane protein [Phocaeicola plebeius CAG:211]|uniref:SusC/RagA family TonB-linked outer membrane protein n=1 Tax=Phocaeicola plebeius CAG:211 TaxID=1263052 RepID=R5VK11_9BACT|nr:TonB-dependent receptor [Phocaeicola plebeius]CCZ88159.1 susC/RagA family TonB-linked outer membrane protein [Phocaeicola plebeius CAG:211]